VRGDIEADHRELIFFHCQAIEAGGCPVGLHPSSQEDDKAGAASPTPEQSAS
jgi:hypothetical protein